jgi:radical SAM superfamily enzyme YgiQ (UPF0313 family)/GT2 family glycosyltransferase
MTALANASPMVAGAEFEADVVLVAPREFEVTRAQQSYREKNFTTFTELLGVNPFQTDHITRINEALGLEALAAYLRAAGVKVAILNCNVAPHRADQIAAKVKQSGARIVGISMIYRPQVSAALEIVEALRGQPDVQIVVGGALASFMPSELLLRLGRLNAVVFGEAEETFCDYVLAVLGGRDWRALPGVAYRDGNRAIINPAALPMDLRHVIAPSRDALTYLKTSGWPTRIASLYTSRGCMAGCTFCTGKDAYNVQRKRTYRFRDPVDVVDEIQLLTEKFGVKFVYINDDNFLGYGAESFARVSAFANELLNRKLEIQFATECRVDALDDDLLLLLKEAGMRQVLLGVESGSDTVLRRWRKGATAEMNRRAIARVRRLGINLEPGFILFDAHTTFGELADNVAFIRETGLDSVAFPTYLVNRISVYPGTQIEKILRNEGIISKSPIQVKLGARFRDEPDAIVQYFDSLEYQCRDVRIEIVWRCLRAALDPIEECIEDLLPRLHSILLEVRSGTRDARVRADVVRLVRLGAQWRRRLGAIVTELLAICARGESVEGNTQLFRWLRRELAEARRRYDEHTCGMSMANYAHQILALHRAVFPVTASVVIPTAGKWSRLARTLRALAAQEVAADVSWEIVLVFDGVDPPEDLIPEVLAERVRHVRTLTALGRGGARNAGLRAARGRFAILLDDDIVVGPNFVSGHLAQQSRRNSLCHGPLKELSELAYVTEFNPVRLSERVPPAARDRLRSIAEKVLVQLDDPAAVEALGRPTRLERDGMNAWQSGRLAGSWVAFAGANLSAPRRWFLEDGFDERPARDWGLEDLGLSLRWLLAGRPLAVADTAVGLHLSHERLDWRAQLDRNQCCLDFLPAEAIDPIMNYIVGAGTIEAVGAAIESVLVASRRKASVVRRAEAAPAAPLSLQTEATP